jgi:hypothetical protein
MNVLKKLVFVTGMKGVWSRGQSHKMILGIKLLTFCKLGHFIVSSIAMKNLKVNLHKKTVSQIDPRLVKLGVNKRSSLLALFVTDK